MSKISFVGLPLRFMALDCTAAAAATATAIYFLIADRGVDSVVTDLKPHMN